jgi:hypothetical protein
MFLSAATWTSVMNCFRGILSRGAVAHGWARKVMKGRSGVMQLCNRIEGWSSEALSRGGSSGSSESGQP